MIASQFFSLIEDLHRLEAEQLDVEACLPRLAELIRSIAEARAAHVRCVRINEGESQPDPQARIILGSAPALEDQGEGGPVGELHMFGRKAVLGDMTEITTWVEVGPTRDGAIEVKDDEVALVIRSRLKRWLVWSVIVGRRSLGADKTINLLLGERINATVRLVAQQWEMKDRTKRRQRFYRSIADHEPRSPDEDFKFLCETWLGATNADWCWLWLYNPLEDRDKFELTACAAKDHNDKAHYPPRRRDIGPGGIGDYTRRRGCPTIIEDIEIWEEKIDETSYGVLLRDELLALGVRSLDHIPIFDPPNYGERKARGLISLHYRKPENRINHSNDSIIAMGVATGLFVQYVKHREEKDTLVELNDLAQEFLAKHKMSPAEARKQYIEELIELIKRRLNVGCVSLFYRVLDREAVQCIGTTGLWWVEGGAPVAPDALSTVVYDGREETRDRFTWKCFSEGRAFVEDYNKDLFTSELGPKVKRRDLEPAAFVPIFGAVRCDLPIGVIRCVEHKSPVFGDALCEFDDAEVERLQVIAKQVGPVLQTFEKRMAREQAISIVKHDLAAPYIMIRDTVAGLLETEDLTDNHREYAFRNLEAAGRMIAALAETLDPDPLGKLECNPEPTYLEGDIIARLKAMMSHYARVQQGMRIEFEDFGCIPKLSVDPALVERAIYNLLVNAVKYGERGSTIRVVPEKRVGEYYVEICNEGIGITEVEAERIFEPGFRSKGAKSRAMGLGLGLAIAKDAMEKTGGQLRLTQLRDPTGFALVFPMKLEVKE